MFIFAGGSLLFTFYVHDSKITIISLVTVGIALLYLLFLLFATIKFERKVFGSYECAETVMYDDCVADGKFE